MPAIISGRIWLVLPLFLAGCNSPERQLNRMWPEKKSFLSTEVVTEGRIHTKSGDSLAGYLKIHSDYISDSVPLLPFDKSKPSDIVQVPTSSIDYISMRFAEKGNSVDYMPIEFKPTKPRHTKKSSLGGFWLYKILGTKNDRRLVYREWGTTDGDGNAVYYGQVILVSGRDRFNFLSNKLMALESNSNFLLALINKRYKQHFRKTDIDVKGRIEFILEMESDRQHPQ